MMTQTTKIIAHRRATALSPTRTERTWLCLVDQILTHKTPSCCCRMLQQLLTNKETPKIPTKTHTIARILYLTMTTYTAASTSDMMEELSTFLLVQIITTTASIGKAIAGRSWEMVAIITSTRRVQTTQTI